jgi:hypothetical protein
LRLEWQHGAEVTVATSGDLDAAAMDELALQHDMVLIASVPGEMIDSSIRLVA